MAMTIVSVGKSCRSEEAGGGYCGLGRVEPTPGGQEREAKGTSLWVETKLKTPGVELVMICGVGDLRS